MKSKLFLTALFAVALSCFGEQYYLENNFENINIQGMPKDHRNGSYKAIPQSFSIQEENGNKYLHISRDPKVGYREFIIGRKFNIMDFFDFKISMDIRPGKTSGGYMWFTDYAGKTRGGLSFSGQYKELVTYDEKMNWVSTGIVRPESGKWFHLDIIFSDSEKSYHFEVTTADGKVQKSKSFPYLPNNGVRNVLFGNAPLPHGNSFDVDNLKISYADEMNIKNRTNGIENAAIIYNGQEIDHNNGIFKTPLNVQLPATFDVQFSGAKYVNSVIVKTAEKLNKHLPFEIIGSNAAGSGEATLIKANLPAQRNIFQQNFVADDFIRAKVVIKGSGTITVNSIYFAGAALPSTNERSAIFRKKIYGDFPCALWQDQTVANMHIFNDRKDNKNHSVKINVAKRNSKTPAFPERIVELKPGKNIITFPISDLANGDYVVSVSDNSGESNGVFNRLLRRYKKFEDTSAITEIGTIKNEKLFFPDNHYFENAENVIFEGKQAQPIQILKPTTNDADFTRIATDLTKDENGKIRLTYYTLNRNWDYDSQYYFQLSTDNIESGKWEKTSFDAKPERIGKTVQIGQWPKIKTQQPDFAAKFSGEKEVFRMYDAERDGAVNLQQLKVRYSGAVANNMLNWKNSSQNWGVMQAIPRAFYLFYRKGMDNTLILSKEAFLIDKPSVGEYEEENTTHDNFGDQWLSADGKTLYFCHVRWLLPSYPYHTPTYDNMNGLRLLHIWKTHDGFNWEKTAFCPPTEADSHTYQQYGTSVAQLKDGNGLFIAFIMRYRSDTQQIDYVLGYSWDGGTWYPVKGAPFAENGPFGSWNAGSMSIAAETAGTPRFFSVTEGNNSYILLSRVDNFYHHQAAQISCFVPNLNKLSVPFLKKALPSLPTWPLFKEAGGYEGFLEHSKNSGMSIGMLKMRRDGFFSAGAADKTASLTTKKISSDGSMLINLAVADNGFAEITLLDESNTPIPGFSKKFEAGFDKVDAEVFTKLPAQDFKINIKMQNAELYTITFK